jgi:hypothetical protein
MVGLKDEDLFNLFVLLLVLLCMNLLFVMYNNSQNDNSDYQVGFTQGYTEHNSTKYKAAVEIRNNYYCYTESQGNYANGYCVGYLTYYQEVRTEEDAKARNDTVNILGI